MSLLLNLYSAPQRRVVTRKLQSLKLACEEEDFVQKSWTWIVITMHAWKRDVLQAKVAIRTESLHAKDFA